MRHFHLRHWLVTLLTCLLIVACSDSTSQLPTAMGCRTLSHVLGTTEICDRPEKVAVLDLHALDLLLSLGAQPAATISILPLQGEVIDQPDQQIPYLGKFITTQPINVGGGLGGNPSLETLTEFKPNLIVGESRYLGSVYDLLAQIGPTVSLDVRSQLGKWQKNLHTLAQALGNEGKADEAIARYHQALETAREDLAPIVAKWPKILVLTAQGLNSGSFYAITSKSFIGEILEELGFELVYLPSTENAVPLSLEALPELDDADSIIVLGFNQTLAQKETADKTDPKVLIEQQMASVEQDWATNEIAQSLTASQADRVYFTTFYEWNLFNGPLGTELILQQLRQFLLAD
ncbi:MAG: ABC transporter substrate-binding protein [Cyanobacteria bacterium P01_F01_bin.86]